MKRYENVTFAVLVIALILLGPMDPSSSGSGLVEGLPHTRRSMVCTVSPGLANLNSVIPKNKYRAKFTKRRYRSRKANPRPENSVEGFASEDGDEDSGAFWLRNACHDGFVVVKEKSRVLSQHEGLGKHNLEVKLVKESCLDLHHNSGLSDRVMTRLYSPSSGRYICFNQRGKVKAVKPLKAERMGHLCAFYEHTVPDPLMTVSGGRPDVSIYVNIQSAYNPKWYLGFGPNLKRRGQEVRVDRGIVHTREGHRASLPRKMHHRGRRKPLNLSKCDFLFATGPWSRQDPESRLKSEWQGLFDHILQHRGSEIKAKITKTAKPLERKSYHLSPSQPTTSVPPQSSSNQPMVPESNSIPTEESSRALKSPVPRSLQPSGPKIGQRQMYKQLKYRYRKRPTSYLYLHNRKRIVPRKKTT